MTEHAKQFNAWQIHIHVYCLFLYPYEVYMYRLKHTTKSSLLVLPSRSVVKTKDAQYINLCLDPCQCWILTKATFTLPCSCHAMIFFCLNVTLEIRLESLSYGMLNLIRIRFVAMRREWEQSDQDSLYRCAERCRLFICATNWVMLLSCCMLGLKFTLNSSIEIFRVRFRTIAKIETLCYCRLLFAWW